MQRISYCVFRCNSGCLAIFREISRTQKEGKFSSGSSKKLELNFNSIAGFKQAVYRGRLSLPRWQTCLLSILYGYFLTVVIVILRPWRPIVCLSCPFSTLPRFPFCFVFGRFRQPIADGSQENQSNHAKNCHKDRSTIKSNAHRHPDCRY